ncbi:hypothetical protein B0H10DRAFT_1939108 [Mycena sp. CBHHK59/15]|nr:hypothetical protein B0H10DRAFT_1939108 [Mycena sp. CBHHK59/15]
MQCRLFGVPDRCQSRGDDEAIDVEDSVRGRGGGGRDGGVVSTGPSVPFASAHGGQPSPGSDSCSDQPLQPCCLKRLAIFVGHLFGGRFQHRGESIKTASTLEELDGSPMQSVATVFKFSVVQIEAIGESGGFSGRELGRPRSRDFTVTVILIVVHTVILIVMRTVIYAKLSGTTPLSRVTVPFGLQSKGRYQKLVEK